MPHKSHVTTRSILVEGAMTTVSLEEPDWRELAEIARENDLTIAELLSVVEDGVGLTQNFSSAVRTYVANNRVRH